MDKEFEEEFGMDNQFLEMLKEEDKMEILANAIASLSELPEFKEDAEAIMQMAETMIEAGFPPDPMELDLVDSKTKQAVVHLIAKKMGVKWTAQMGYGEMRMKQNYPESTDMVMNLLGKRKVKIKEDPDLEKIVKELEGASKMHLGQSKRIQKHLDKMDKMNVEIGEAMNPKDHVKEKDGKFEVIAPSGKVVYSSDDKKEAEEWAVKNHDALMKEEVEIDEAKMKPDMLDTLKKKYESLRGKRLSLGQNMEIAKIVSGMSRDKEVLIQLVKADIPFISLNAATLLMDKHGMKAKDINLAKEEVEVDESVEVDGRKKAYKEALKRAESRRAKVAEKKIEVELARNKWQPSEGIDIQKADMKDVIKDFKTSDAPQFKGKSDKKRKEMAIAAKLSKEENEDDDPVGKSKKKSKKDVINLKPTAESSMKKFKDIMTKLKEKRFNTAEETTNLKKEVEIEESDGYEVEAAAKKMEHKWKRMSKAEKVRFLDKMDVLAGKTKVSDSDLEDILGDRGLTMEASGDKEAYQKFFQGALKKYGVKSPAELKGDKKKEFFDYVDKNWTGDHEEETTTKKSLKDAVADMKEKKLKVQEALTIGGVEVGEQDFDKGARLAHAAPNLGMTYADYQAKFKTDGLEGPYQIDGGAYFWDKAATKWFSVETEDYVDGKRNAELNFRYTKQGTAGGGLMHTRRL